MLRLVAGGDIYWTWEWVLPPVWVWIIATVGCLAAVSYFVTMGSGYSGNEGDGDKPGTPS